VIKQPLTRQLWFQLFSLIALCSLLYLGISWIQRRRLSELNQTLDSERMRSLMQQINPHFVYNTLNSIQFFIFKDKKIEAENYLSKFSNMMRKNFEFSGKDYITLKEELDHLENYIEMQRIRFENQIQTNLNIELSLRQKNYLVPPFLIQPIIENSFKHGLRHSQTRASILDLNVKLKKPYIEISVKDNGIGRVESSKNKAFNLNRSSSTKNLEKRIQLLNKLRKYKANPITFEILDLYDENKMSEGTLVTFKFPIQQ